MEGSGWMHMPTVPLPSLAPCSSSCSAWPAWTWIRFAKRPEERENVAYTMAAVLGYTALMVAYVLLIYI